MDYCVERRNLNSFISEEQFMNKQFPYSKKLQLGSTQQAEIHPSFSNQKAFQTASPIYSQNVNHHMSSDNCSVDSENHLHELTSQPHQLQRHDATLLFSSKDEIPFWRKAFSNFREKIMVPSKHQPSHSTPIPSCSPSSSIRKPSWQHESYTPSSQQSNYTRVPPPKVVFSRNRRQKELPFLPIIKTNASTVESPYLVDEINGKAYNLKNISPTRTNRTDCSEITVDHTFSTEFTHTSPIHPVTKTCQRRVAPQIHSTQSTPSRPIVWAITPVKRPIPHSFSNTIRNEPEHCSYRSNMNHSLESSRIQNGTATLTQLPFPNPVIQRPYPAIYEPIPTAHRPPRPASHRTGLLSLCTSCKSDVMSQVNHDARFRLNNRIVSSDLSINNYTRESSPSMKIPNTRTYTSSSFNQDVCHGSLNIEQYSSDNLSPIFKSSSDPDVLLPMTITKPDNVMIYDAPGDINDSNPISVLTSNQELLSETLRKNNCNNQTLDRLSLDHLMSNVCGSTPQESVNTMTHISSEDTQIQNEMYTQQLKEDTDIKINQKCEVKRLIYNSNSSNFLQREIVNDKNNENSLLCHKSQSPRHVSFLHELWETNNSLNCPQSCHTIKQTQFNQNDFSMMQQSNTMFLKSCKPLNHLDIDKENITITTDIPPTIIHNSIPMKSVDTTKIDKSIKCLYNIEPDLKTHHLELFINDNSSRTDTDATYDSTEDMQELMLLDTFKMMTDRYHINEINDTSIIQDPYTTITSYGTRLDNKQNIFNSISSVAPSDEPEFTNVSLFKQTTTRSYSDKDLKDNQTIVIPLTTQLDVSPSNKIQSVCLNSLPLLKKIECSHPDQSKLSESVVKDTENVSLSYNNVSTVPENFLNNRNEWTYQDTQRNKTHVDDDASQWIIMHRRDNTVSQHDPVISTETSFTNAPINVFNQNSFGVGAINNYTQESLFLTSIEDGHVIDENDDKITQKKNLTNACPILTDNEFLKKVERNNIRSLSTPRPFKNTVTADVVSLTLQTDSFLKQNIQSLAKNPIHQRLGLSTDTVTFTGHLIEQNQIHNIDLCRKNKRYLQPNMHSRHATESYNLLHNREISTFIMQPVEEASVNHIEPYIGDKGSLENNPQFYSENVIFERLVVDEDCAATYILKPEKQASVPIVEPDKVMERSSETHIQVYNENRTLDNLVDNEKSETFLVKPVKIVEPCIVEEEASENDIQLYSEKSTLDNLVDTEDSATFTMKPVEPSVEIAEPCIVEEKASENDIQLCSEKSTLDNLVDTEDSATFRMKSVEPSVEIIEPCIVEEKASENDIQLCSEKSTLDNLVDTEDSATFTLKPVEPSVEIAEPCIVEEEASENDIQLYNENGTLDNLVDTEDSATFTMKPVEPSVEIIEPCIVEEKASENDIQLCSEKSTLDNLVDTEESATFTMKPVEPSVEIVEPCIVEEEASENDIQLCSEKSTLETLVDTEDSATFTMKPVEPSVEIVESCIVEEEVSENDIQLYNENGTLETLVATEDSATFTMKPVEPLLEIIELCMVEEEASENDIQLYSEKSTLDNLVDTEDSATFTMKPVEPLLEIIELCMVEEEASENDIQLYSEKSTLDNLVDIEDSATFTMKPVEPSVEIVEPCIEEEKASENDIQLCSEKSTLDNLVDTEDSATFTMKPVEPSVEIVEPCIVEEKASENDIQLCSENSTLGNLVDTEGSGTFTMKPVELSVEIIELCIVEEEASENDIQLCSENSTLDNLVDTKDSATFTMKPVEPSVEIVELCMVEEEASENDIQLYSEKSTLDNLVDTEDSATFTMKPVEPSVEIVEPCIVEEKASENDIQLCSENSTLGNLVDTEDSALFTMKPVEPSVEILESCIVEEEVSKNDIQLCSEKSTLDNLVDTEDSATFTMKPVEPLLEIIELCMVEEEASENDIQLYSEKSTLDNLVDIEDSATFTMKPVEPSVEIVEPCIEEEKASENDIQLCSEKSTLDNLVDTEDSATFTMKPVEPSVEIVEPCIVEEKASENDIQLCSENSTLGNLVDTEDSGTFTMKPVEPSVEIIELCIVEEEASENDIQLYSENGTLETLVDTEDSATFTMKPVEPSVEIVEPCIEEEKASENDIQLCSEKSKLDNLVDTEDSATFTMKPVEPSVEIVEPCIVEEKASENDIQLCSENSTLGNLVDTEDSGTFTMKPVEPSVEIIELCIVEEEASENDIQLYSENGTLETLVDTEDSATFTMKPVEPSVEIVEPCIVEEKASENDIQLCSEKSTLDKLVDTEDSATFTMKPVEPSVEIVEPCIVEEKASENDIQLCSEKSTLDTLVDIEDSALFTMKPVELSVGIVESCIVEEEVSENDIQLCSEKSTSDNLVDIEDSATFTMKPVEPSVEIVEPCIVEEKASENDIQLCSENSTLGNLVDTEDSALFTMKPVEPSVEILESCIVEEEVSKNDIQLYNENGTLETLVATEDSATFTMKPVGASNTILEPYNIMEGSLNKDCQLYNRNVFFEDLGLNEENVTFTLNSVEPYKLMGESLEKDIQLYNGGDAFFDDLMFNKENATFTLNLVEQASVTTVEPYKVMEGSFKEDLQLYSENAFFDDLMFNDENTTFIKPILEDVPIRLKNPLIEEEQFLEQNKSCISTSLQDLGLNRGKSLPTVKPIDELIDYYIKPVAQDNNYKKHNELITPSNTIHTSVTNTGKKKSVAQLIKEGLINIPGLWIDEATFFEDNKNFLTSITSLENGLVHMDTLISASKPIDELIDFYTKPMTLEDNCDDHDLLSDDIILDNLITNDRQSVFTDHLMNDNLELEMDIFKQSNNESIETLPSTCVGSNGNISESIVKHQEYFKPYTNDSRFLISNIQEETFDILSRHTTAGSLSFTDDASGFMRPETDTSVLMKGCSQITLDDMIKEEQNDIVSQNNAYNSLLLNTPQQLKLFMSSCLEPSQLCKNHIPVQVDCNNSKDSIATIQNSDRHDDDDDNSDISTSKLCNISDRTPSDIERINKSQSFCLLNELTITPHVDVTECTNDQYLKACPTISLKKQDKIEETPIINSNIINVFKKPHLTDHFFDSLKAFPFLHCFQLSSSQHSIFVKLFQYLTHPVFLDVLQSQKSMEMNVLFNKNGINRHDNVNMIRLAFIDGCLKKPIFDERHLCHTHNVNNSSIQVIAAEKKTIQHKDVNTKENTHSLVTCLKNDQTVQCYTCLSTYDHDHYPLLSTTVTDINTDMKKTDANNNPFLPSLLTSQSHHPHKTTNRFNQKNVAKLSSITFSQGCIQPLSLSKSSSFQRVQCIRIQYLPEEINNVRDLTGDCNHHPVSCYTLNNPVTEHHVLHTPCVLPLTDNSIEMNDFVVSALQQHCVHIHQDCLSKENTGSTQLTQRELDSYSLKHKLKSLSNTLQVSQHIMTPSTIKKIGYLNDWSSHPCHYSYAKHSSIINPCKKIMKSTNHRVSHIAQNTLQFETTYDLSCPPIASSNDIKCCHHLNRSIHSSFFKKTRIPTKLYSNRIISNPLCTINDRICNTGLPKRSVTHCKSCPIIIGNNHSVLHMDNSDVSVQKKNLSTDVPNDHKAFSASHLIHGIPFHCAARKERQRRFKKDSNGFEYPLSLQSPLPPSSEHHVELSKLLYNHSHNDNKHVGHCQRYIMQNTVASTGLKRYSNIAARKEKPHLQRFHSTTAQNNCSVDDATGGHNVFYPFLIGTKAYEAKTQDVKQKLLEKSHHKFV